MKTMFALAVLAAVLALPAGCRSARSDSYWTAADIKRSRLHAVTLSEIEAGKNPGMPVPEPSAGWTNFTRQVLPGDQIWYFCVPAAAGRKDAIGWRGYALYRAESLVATFTVADP
jgi:hypothetical protein